MLDQTHPRAVVDLVSRLVDALTGRGLVAVSIGENMVRVANRAADPPGNDANAPMSPGLRQTVVCQPDGEGRLAWWWLWSSPTEDPEYEWLCPGMEITIAVDAIVRVLAVQSVDERAGA